MKISISYPPLESEKGVALLTQNRQFQWFKKPTYIYPVVPAQAATLLKENGFDVIWDDAIAEGKTYERWLTDINALKPDIIVMETKTPVIKRHWQIINDLKSLVTGHWALATVIMGDHVTAFPEESFQNSKVDYVITGGDYDFLLLNLCNYLKNINQRLATSGQRPVLEPGIYYRENGAVKNNGPFQLNHDLNQVPFIDRDLTKWKLYAYENGNYKCVPGTYTMAGRDCWWAKCRFCLTPDMKVLTKNGLVSILSLFNDRNNEKSKLMKVMTHKGRYERVNKYYRREYTGQIIKMDFYNIKMPIKITPNHKMYALKAGNTKRCSRRRCWNYICKPDRKSNFLSCGNCDKKYYNNYDVNLIRADELKVGDYVAIPIITDVKDLQKIFINDFLCESKKPTIKKIKNNLIEEILSLYKIGVSQRGISRNLCVDRSTVRRYIKLEKTNTLNNIGISLLNEDGYISFEQGRQKILSEVKITKNFMRLIGYYLAEGHVHKIKDRPNSYQLGLTFSEKEIEYIEDVKNIMNECLQYNPKIVHNKINHTIQITAGCTIFARLFEKLFGSPSVNKNIPEFVMCLPKEKQRDLIVGLFRGDGHLRRREYRESGSEYIYETASPVLAQQVFMLLLRQGSIPIYRERIPRGPKMKHTIYSLSLSHLDIIRLFPDSHLPKRVCNYKRAFILNNYAFIPIKKIDTELYNGFVYNLSVENDHSYTVNNVAVSNCSWTTTYPTFRSRRPENLLNEIGQLVEKYNIKEIMDDTGTFPAGEWLRTFCKGMIDSGYNKKINLDCNMRFNAVTPDDYKLMKQANFRLLLFGIESGNQYTLDRINKGVKIEEIIESCKQARMSGLFPHITIMFGYPWETYEDASKTLELGRWLLKKGYAYTVQATVVIPYPGTPLFEECKQNGWLKTLDWDNYDMKQPVMKTPMSDEQIMKLVQGIYSVAFNPEFIVRRISSVTTASDIKYFMRGMKKVFGHIFDFKPKNQ